MAKVKLRAYPNNPEAVGYDRRLACRRRAFAKISAGGTPAVPVIRTGSNTRAVRRVGRLCHAPLAGRGIGLAEVPRGLLVHDYDYDADGVCTRANCVIPTAMNLGNVDLDMQAYVPRVIAARSQDQIAHDLEMLVRAYDPCISCSVHLLKVNWV